MTPPISDLSALIPQVADSARALMNAAAQSGLKLTPIETRRSQARQDSLYAQGRTAPGPVVTWTRQSYHTPGAALDFLVNDDESGTDPGYDWLQQNAPKFGFGVLGSKDPGHVEMPSAIPPDDDQAPQQRSDPGDELRRIAQQYGGGADAGASLRALAQQYGRPPSGDIDLRDTTPTAPERPSVRTLAGALPSLTPVTTPDVEAPPTTARPATSATGPAVRPDVTRVGPEPSAGIKPSMLERIATFPLSVAFGAVQHPIDFAMAPVNAALTLNRATAEQDAENAIASSGGPIGAVERTVTPKETAIAGAQVATALAAPELSEAVSGAVRPALRALAGDATTIAGRRAIAGLAGHMAAAAPVGAAYTPNDPIVGAFGSMLLALPTPAGADVAQRAVDTGHQAVADLVNSARQANEAARTQGAQEARQQFNATVARVLPTLDANTVAYIQRDPILGPLSRDALKQAGVPVGESPPASAPAGNSDFPADEPVSVALANQPKTRDVFPGSLRVLSEPQPSTEPPSVTGTTVPTEVPQVRTTEPPPEPQLEPQPTREEAPAVDAGDQLRQLAQQYGAANDVAHVPGRETRVLLRTGEALPAQYRVISASDLQSSHDPFSFEPNPQYPEGVQGRDYLRNKASQQAVAQRALEYNPDIALNPSESISEGAPTTLPNGTVIAGNERSMLPRRAAVQAPDKYAAYVEQLKARAPEFGLDPNAIESVDHPVLVRALTNASDVEGGPARWAAINRASDEIATKAKSAAEEGAARAAKLAQATDALDHLSLTLSPEQTINEYLGTPDGRTFVRKLMTDGVITSDEFSRLADVSGGVTEDGRSAVRRMLLGTAVTDPSAILDAPASMVGKIEHAVPSIVTTKGTTFDISALTTAALKMAAEAHDNGITIQDLASQGSLFGERRASPNVTALASFLDESKPSAVRSAYRRYAALAREALGNAETTDMFGGTGFDTPAAAFREAFGATEPETVPAEEPNVGAGGMLFAEIPSEQRRTSAPTRAGELLAEARSPREAGAGRAISESPTPTTPDVAVRGVNKYLDALKQVFAPADRGEEARLTGLTVREHDAALVHRFEQAKTALMDFAKTMDAFPVREQLEFIDRLETGKSQPTVALQEFARTIRGLLDSTRDQIRSLGDGQLEHWIENYFPHIWADPAKAKSIIGAIMGKRSLTGPGSFLKKRVIPTVREGIEAGLTPVTYNPIDLTLLKLREMHRYLAGQRILQEMKSDGRLKFVSSFAQAPDGLEKINDKVSTVYGPPRVSVTEAYDYMVRSKLEQVMRDLGVKHERRPNIGGGSEGGVRLGYAVGKSNITTRSATPESVIEHELGHALDAQLGLWKRLHDYPGDPKSKEAVAYRKAITVELRNLADLRHEGIAPEDVPQSLQQYVRSRPEKIANAVMGLIYAPDRMRQVAPTVMGRLREILSENPTTRKILDIKPSFRHGADTFDVGTPGMVVLGHWYAPEPVARVVNNYLSPGLSNAPLGPFFDVYRGAGNLLNMAQLGLSAYHLGFTSLDAIVSKNALGLLQLREGHPLEAAKSFATAPLAPVTTAMKGFRVKQAYLRGTTDPVLGKMIDALKAAGGRAKMDEFYGGTAWRQAKLALHEGQYLKGAAKLVPAAIEQSTSWLMQHVVPWQKLGVFYDLAQHELEKLPPGADRAQVRAVMARAWDSVENRMGQLTYNNLFWHRYLKDGLMASVRSVGWNLGTMREIPGGVADLARGRLTPKASYVIALPATVALFGGIYHYLHTGQVPSSLKDWFFPKTGRKNPNGSDERVQLPSYMRDVFDFHNDWRGTLANKVNPLAVSIKDMLSNRDFYGNEIVNGDDPLPKEIAQGAAWVAKQFEPFGTRNIRTQLQQGQSLGTAAQSFVGITPAPRRELRTAAEARMTDILARRGHGVATPEEAEQRSARHDLTSQLRKGIAGDSTAASEALRSLAEQYGAGSMTKGQARHAISAAKVPASVAQFKQLTAAEALDVYEHAATPAEREQYRPYLLMKLRGSAGRNLPIPPDLRP
jgi:hypothetical protein